MHKSLWTIMAVNLLLGYNIYGSAEKAAKNISRPATPLSTNLFDDEPSSVNFHRQPRPKSSPADLDDITALDIQKLMADFEKAFAEAIEKSTGEWVNTSKESIMQSQLTDAFLPLEKEWLAHHYNILRAKLDRLNSILESLNRSDDSTEPDITATQLEAKRASLKAAWSRLQDLSKKRILDYLEKRNQLYRQINCRLTWDETKKDFDLITPFQTSRPTTPSRRSPVRP